VTISENIQVDQPQRIGKWYTVMYTYESIVVCSLDCSRMFFYLTWCPSLEHLVRAVNEIGAAQVI